MFKSTMGIKYLSSHCKDSGALFFLQVFLRNRVYFTAKQTTSPYPRVFQSTQLPEGSSPENQTEIHGLGVKKVRDGYCLIASLPRLNEIFASGKYQELEEKKAAVALMRPILVKLKIKNYSKLSFTLCSIWLYFSAFILYIYICFRHIPNWYKLRGNPIFN